MGHPLLGSKSCHESEQRYQRLQKDQEDTRQGCVLFLDLFNIYSEMILRELEDIEGMKIGNYNCNNLRHADDTILIASSKKTSRE